MFNYTYRCKKACGFSSVENICSKGVPIESVVKYLEKSEYLIFTSLINLGKSKVILWEWEMKSKNF